MVEALAATWREGHRDAGRGPRAYITGACIPIDGGITLSNLTLGSER